MITNEAPTSIPIKYSNFADVFFLELALEIFEYTRINNYTIELIDEQQQLYRPIYSLEQVELKTLKIYIKTNLANSFIRPFKSPAKAPILFDKKLD